jgi:hypothetical protein
MSLWEMFDVVEAVFKYVGILRASPCCYLDVTHGLNAGIRLSPFIHD